MAFLTNLILFRILELGAGTGILGMSIIKKFHPKWIGLTDGDTKAMELLDSNLRENNIETNTQVGTHFLQWGESITEFQNWLTSYCQLNLESDGTESLDCVVAGDVLYKAYLPDLFFQTVAVVLPPGQPLWLCHVPRSTVTHDVVLRTASNYGFTWTVVATDLGKIQGCPMEDLSRARVYRFTRI